MKFMCALNVKCFLEFYAHHTSKDFVFNIMDVFNNKNKKGEKY